MPVPGVEPEQGDPAPRPAGHDVPGGGQGGLLSEAPAGEVDRTPPRPLPHDQHALRAAARHHLGRQADP